MRKLTPTEARSMAAARTKCAGGRPREKKRCACGAMSLKRALARYHQCASES